MPSPVPFFVLSLPEYVEHLEMTMEWSTIGSRLQSSVGQHFAEQFFSLERDMSTNETHTWPELAIGLYDQLTQRNAEIDYNFENLEVTIPSSTNPDARRAQWKLNGGIRVTTRNGAAS